MPETKLESRTPHAVDTAQPKSHGLALKDRRHLAVTGVIRVISCDENAARQPDRRRAGTADR